MSEQQVHELLHRATDDVHPRDPGDLLAVAKQERRRRSVFAVAVAASVVVVIGTAVAVRGINDPSTAPPAVDEPTQPGDPCRQTQLIRVLYVDGAPARTADEALRTFMSTAEEAALGQRRPHVVVADAPTIDVRLVRTPTGWQVQRAVKCVPDAVALTGQNAALSAAGPTAADLALADRVARFAQTRSTADLEAIPFTPQVSLALLGRVLDTVPIRDLASAQTWDPAHVDPEFDVIRSALVMLQGAGQVEVTIGPDVACYDYGVLPEVPRFSSLRQVNLHPQWTATMTADGCQSGWWSVSLLVTQRGEIAAVEIVDGIPPLPRN